MAGTAEESLIGGFHKYLSLSEIDESDQRETSPRQPFRFGEALGVHPPDEKGAGGKDGVRMPVGREFRHNPMSRNEYGRRLLRGAI